MTCSHVPHEMAECMRWATNTAFLPLLPGLYMATAMNRVYEEALRAWGNQFEDAVLKGCRQMQEALLASLDAPEGAWSNPWRI